MAVTAERSVRVSTLELFFDLVFVFTITQLTGVLVEGKDAAAVVQVVVMLLLIWWMYDGYAWLTNAIATDLLRFRLLLIGGMGAFLVIALAVPDAFDGDGLAFGLGYLVVVVLHAGMFVRGTSVSEVRAILRIAPFNLVAAALVLAGGALGGGWQWALWSFSAVLLWISPRFTTVEGFVVSVPHFVERHGLVVIVALGESVVVIGAGAAGLPVDAGLVLVALLSLSLSAALWWVYFSDEDDVGARIRGRAAGAAPGARAARVRLLALRNPARDRRRRGRAQEGDRRPVRAPRRMDRERPCRRYRALHRVRRRLPADVRHRAEPRAPRRGCRRARDDRARDGGRRRGTGGRNRRARHGRVGGGVSRTARALARNSRSQMTSYACRATHTAATSASATSAWTTSATGIRSAHAAAASGLPRPSERETR